MVNFRAHQFNGEDGKLSSTAVLASLTEKILYVYPCSGH